MLCQLEEQAKARERRQREQHRRQQTLITTQDRPKTPATAGEVRAKQTTRGLVRVTNPANVMKVTTVQLDYEGRFSANSQRDSRGSGGSPQRMTSPSTSKSIWGCMHAGVRMRS